MKIPFGQATTRESLKATAVYNSRWFASLLAGSAALAGGALQAADWTGATDTNWNNPANWSTAAVPAGENAVVNATTPNVATISANIAATPVDIMVGDGAGKTGLLQHTAGTASTGGGNWVYVGTRAATGTYNLANAATTGGALTGMGASSGSLTAQGRLYVGGVGFDGSGGTGTFNLNTTGTLTMGNDLVVGVSGGTGVFNMDAGTVTTGGWNYFGFRDSGDNGNGTLNMGGGTITNNGARTFIGVGNATGTMNLSGGTYNNIAGGANTFFAVGVNNLGNANTPALNMTGGTLNVASLFSVGGVEAHGGDGNATFVGAGKGNATINNANALLNVTGELWVGQGTGSTGLLTFSAGTITTSSWVAIGRGGGTGTVNMSGGTWNKTGGTGTHFIVGASGPGVLNQTGGSVSVQAGLVWIGEQNASVGTWTLSGGTVTAGDIVVAVNGGSTGTFELDGGTLTADRITGGGGTDTVNFNGTQIVAKSNQTSYITGLTTAEVEAGGLKVDSAGFSLVADQSLTGTGAVTKSGAGSLTLTGFNSHSGGNVVNGGKLTLTGDYTGTGPLSVANGAAFGYNSNFAGAVFEASSATFGTSGPTTLDVDLGNSGNPTATVIKVVGALTLNGTTTVNISSTSLAVGTIPLVRYGSKTGSGSMILGTLPPGVVGTLNAVASGYDLVITSVGLSEWRGNVSSNWDTTTLNWVDLTVPTPPAATYANGDFALFNDNLTGSPNVVLNLTVTPGAVEFDNSTAVYTLTGTGKISGTGGLTKSGTSSLTIGTANDYTGVTTLEGGKATVGALANGGAASPLGAASAASSNLVFAGGTLDYTGGAATIDRGYTINASANNVVSTLSTANNLTISGAVNGLSGGFTKAGAGILTLNNAGTSTLATGGFRVEEGRAVISGGTHAIGGQLGMGAASHVELANTTITNSGDTNVGDVAGAESTLTLSGTTTYTTPNRVMSGMPAGASGSIVVQNSAKLIQTANWLSIGQNGTGSLLVKDSGTLTVPGDFNIGDVGTSSGSMTVQDNAVVTGGATFFGKNTGTTGTVNLSGGTFTGAASYVARYQNSAGTVTQTGGIANMGGNNEFFIGADGTGTWNQSAGTVNASGWTVIGRYVNGTGNLNVSGGTFNQTQVDRGFLIGEEGKGTVTITGGAVNSVWTNGIVIGNGATGDGTLNLNGGTLTTVSIHKGSGGTSKLNFGGGLLKAGPTANIDFITGLDSVKVEAGGANIDSNGMTIRVVSGMEAGATVAGLVKTGAGTLLLNGTNGYLGATTVSAGTLGGNGLLAGSLSVPAGSTFAPGDGGTGVFTVEQATTIAGTFAVEVDGAANDLLLADGALNITGSTLTVTALGGGATEAAYVIASYPSGGLTGTFAATNLPPGYSVNYAYNDGVSSNNIAIVGGGATPYSTWIGTYFPGQTDPAIVGPTADPDKDGQSNAVEFALGGAPNSGTNNAKVYSLLADSDDSGTDREQLMTIAVRTGTPAFSTDASPTATKDGFTYTIQGSTTLSSFTTTVVGVAPVTTNLPGAPTGYEYRTFSLSGSNNLPGKGFLRVQITP